MLRQTHVAPERALCARVGAKEKLALQQLVAAHDLSRRGSVAVAVPYVVVGIEGSVASELKTQIIDVGLHVPPRYSVIHCPHVSVTLETRVWPVMTWEVRILAAAKMRTWPAVKSPRKNPLCESSTVFGFREALKASSRAQRWGWRHCVR
jgi:hypothetical protein